MSNPPTTSDLAARSCKDCQSAAALEEKEISRLLPQLTGWQRDGKEISRTFKFKNYYETIAFVNATAWISHREDHHPDLAVGYNQCTVRYSTHSAGGLTESDFICAAKIDKLLSI